MNLLTIGETVFRNSMVSREAIKQTSPSLGILNQQIEFLLLTAVDILATIHCRWPAPKAVPAPGALTA